MLRFPPRSPALAVFRRSLFLGFLGALPACGDDEKAAVVPLKDPTLRIEELRPVGGSPVPITDESRAGTPRVELGSDENATIVVKLADVTNWRFGPPFACLGPRCGFVLLTVEPEGGDGSLALEIPAAGRYVPAPMKSFRSVVPPRVRFRVELRDAQGTPVKNDAGAIFHDEITVEIIANTGDAGAAPDGAGPDGGDGGAPEASPRDGAAPDGADLDGALRDATLDSSDTGVPEAAPPDGSLDASADGGTPEAGAPDASGADSGPG